MGLPSIGPSRDSSIKLQHSILTVDEASIPRFIATKGGLTAYEVAQRALRVRSCNVLGQLLPGVPVWEIEVNHHRLPYLVFPGNVGTHTSLREAVEMFL